MKYFTLAEAEALISKIEEIFKAVDVIISGAEKRAREIRKLSGGEAPQSDLAVAHSQLQFLENQANGWLEKIARWGALPKGIDPPLVDFPFRLEGREVYLCWMRGEKRISHYHGLEEGFSGRKRLSPKARPGLNISRRSRQTEL